MRRALVAAILMFVLVPSLFSKGSREVEPTPVRAPLDRHDTFVVGIPAGGDEFFLDPVGANDAVSLMVLDGLFEGLFSLDPRTAEPVPAIAREFSVSPDGLTWTFTLDDDGRFSNGEVIDSSTFLESWFWLLDETAGRGSDSYLVSMLECIEGVRAYREGNANRSSVGIRAKGPFQLEITLGSAAPYLPALLATLPFSAIHETLRKQDKVIDPETMVSSGPYVVAKAGPDSILLEKHPWYRDYRQVPSDYVQFLVKEPLELVEGYREGSIHWSLAFIPRQLLHSFGDLHIAPEYSTGFFYFSARSGAYANERVRQALGMLVPWNEVRRQSGQVFPTDRLIPDHGGWDSGAEDTGSEEMAFKMLSEEGFPYGAGLPPLGMAVHRGSQVEQSARMIADIWSAKLGITVILDVVPLSMYSRFPSRSPYDFAFITWIGDIHDPFAFLHLWTSESGYNLGNLNDARYDSLVTRAMEIGDPQERVRLERLAEEHLLKNAVVFPVYHGITTNIVNSRLVKGWHDNTLNIHPLKYLEVIRP